MTKKLNDIFLIVWVFLTVSLTTDVVWTGIEFFGTRNIERGIKIFNVCCLFSIIIFATLLINFVFVPLALWIKGKIKK